MATLENIGLRVVEVQDGQGLSGEPAAPAGAAAYAVRLDAGRFDWDIRRRKEDIVVRPRWVHWVCPAIGGAAGVIARQSHKQRQRSRVALRSLAALEIQVSEPIDRALLDEWTVPYEAQVRRLANGRNLAGLFRRRILEPDSGHTLVLWRDRGRLVCGMVFGVDPECSSLAVRFNAVEAGWRDCELPRAMYLAAADMAAERGLRWVTLGTDVNLTGGMITPGLSLFKLRLGFRPVPADLFGVESDDVAERLISVDGLTRPVLRFEYRRPRPANGTVDDFFAGADALGMVAVAYAGEDYADLLPPHRRLTVAG